VRMGDRPPNSSSGFETRPAHDGVIIPMQQYCGLRGGYTSRCGQIEMTYRQNVMDSRYIAASDFEANCLRLMDEVAQQRRPIIITRRGKPVAKLVPIETEAVELFGRMAGSVKICGDIINPIEDVGWTGDDENV
jgi:prevent-host-death family protein